MKSKTSILLSVLMMALLSGCKFEAANLGSALVSSYKGTEGGNPMTTYYNKKYAYGIQFFASLNFAEIGDGDLVSIDNRAELAKRSNPADRLSSLTIEGTKLVQPITLADLRRMYFNETANMDIYDYNGLKGYYIRWTEGDLSYGNYYFLFAEHIIHAEFRAYKEAEGWEKIATIMDSFWDGAPPEIQEIKLDAGPWKKGQIYHVLFRASDGSSGLDLEAPARDFEGAYFYDEISKTRLQSFEPFKNLGGGWYSQDIVVDSSLLSGNYKLLYFSAKDTAGNLVTLIPAEYVQINPNPDFFGTYVVQKYSTGYPTGIPQVSVNIED